MSNTCLLPVPASFPSAPRPRAMARLAAGLLSCGLGLGALAALAPEAGATDGAVYTMTNAPHGNEVIVLQRDETTGALTRQARVPTDGAGTGAPLGNQGALALTADERLLLVVNPGSHTISSLAVTEDGLRLVDTAPSGGRKPVSLSIHGDFVAVLHAGGDVGSHDSVTLLYLNPDGSFRDLRGMSRLSRDATSPAQVSFVQEGHVLVVTEKATGAVDTIQVRHNGALGRLVVHDADWVTPFGFAPVSRDQLVITDAARGTLRTCLVDREGRMDNVGHVMPTGQAATCWAVATPGGRRVYATNTGSGTVTGAKVDFGGGLELLSRDGVSAVTGAGPIDAALSDDGRFLYVLSADNDAIDAFEVRDDGGLTVIESERGLPDGANGLVAR